MVATMVDRNIVLDDSLWMEEEGLHIDYTGWSNQSIVLFRLDNERKLSRKGKAFASHWFVRRREPVF